MFRRTLTALPLAALLAAGLAAPSAWADTIHFHARLTGDAQVPPVDTKATGVANAVLDTTTKTLKFRITYHHLSGKAVMAHFHGPADAGANAPVAVPITGKLTSPIHGSVTLTDAQIADLEAGKWYVNIHTELHKDGEIRGQMIEKTKK